MLPLGRQTAHVAHKQCTAPGAQRAAAVRFADARGPWKRPCNTTTSSSSLSSSVLSSSNSSPQQQLPSTSGRHRPEVRCHQAQAASGVSGRVDEAEFRDGQNLWDTDKEQSRVYRRTMFTTADWKAHRGTQRYTRHLKTIFHSRIVRSIMRPVLVITASAFAVAAFQTLHAMQQLPSWLPALPAIPMEPFQLTSMALSLLLVFRTNSSYARWEEGRMEFGRICTTSRDICRQVLAMFPRNKSNARDLMARWLIAYARACKWCVREEEPVVEELQTVLQPHEQEAMLSSSNPPYYALMVLSHAVANAGLDDQARVNMEAGLSALVHAFSSCDRILNTPIPLSYTRHTARFLIIWLMLLPLGLWPLCGWTMVPASAFIAFVLLGVEEIGVQVEEPFSILALEQLCANTERHIAGMMIMDASAFKLAMLSHEQLQH